MGYCVIHKSVAELQTNTLNFDLQVRSRFSYKTPNADEWRIRHTENNLFLNLSRTVENVYSLNAQNTKLIQRINEFYSNCIWIFWRPKRLLNNTDCSFLSSTIIERAIFFRIFQKITILISPTVWKSLFSERSTYSSGKHNPEKKYCNQGKYIDQEKKLSGVYNTTITFSNCSHQG